MEFQARLEPREERILEAEVQEGLQAMMGAAKSAFQTPPGEDPRRDNLQLCVTENTSSQRCFLALQPFLEIYWKR